MTKSPRRLSYVRPQLSWVLRLTTVVPHTYNSSKSSMHRETEPNQVQPPLRNRTRDSALEKQSSFPMDTSSTKQQHKQYCPSQNRSILLVSHKIEVPFVHHKSLAFWLTVVSRSCNMTESYSYFNIQFAKNTLASSPTWTSIQPSFSEATILFNLWNMLAYNHQT